jgi:hypothetical protein
MAEDGTDPDASARYTNCGQPGTYKFCGFNIHEF